MVCHGVAAFLLNDPSRTPSSMASAVPSTFCSSSRSILKVRPAVRAAITELPDIDSTT